MTPRTTLQRPIAPTAAARAAQVARVAAVALALACTAPRPHNTEPIYGASGASQWRYVPLTALEATEAQWPTKAEFEHHRARCSEPVKRSPKPLESAEPAGSTEPADGTDVTAGTDLTDGTELTNAAESTDASELTDATDVVEMPSPGSPATDACLASHGFYPTVCSDGVDNDGDGLIDHPSDPGCAEPDSITEDPACDDGRDNDGDGHVDWDGGGVAHPDPDCENEPSRDDEREERRSARFGIF